MFKPTTKRAQLTALISRKSGARIEALQRQLNWQPHTIRAEISRLRKSGLIVTCNTAPGGSIYKARHPAAVSDGA